MYFNINSFSVCLSLIKCLQIIFSILNCSAPRLVNLTSKLSSIAAVEGKDVIFKCSVTPADVKVKWFRNNVPITAGPKYKIEHRATSHSLTITSVSQEDAGEISMAAEGKTCSATLQVQRKNQPLFAFTLTV